MGVQEVGALTLRALAGLAPGAWMSGSLADGGHREGAPGTVTCLRVC